jgi:hypothetical protein
VTATIGVLEGFEKAGSDIGFVVGRSVLQSLLTQSKDHFHSIHRDT